MRFLLLLPLFFTACTSAPKVTNALRISCSTYPTTLDPQRAGDFVSSTLICMVYEGLTRCLPGGEVELALAERVEVSADQKTYLFHLRKAFWSNGKAITAFDFESSWKAIFDSPSACTYLFYPIRNAVKCAKGEIGVDAVGITALNERVLCVELERPTPYFLSLTAFPSFLPAPPENGLYSGPFQIVKRVNHSEILLVKNESFWNRGAIALDAVHISIVPDEMTALQMFERGDLDWLGSPLSPLPPDALEKLKDKITFAPSAATTFCSFNTTAAPFHNLHLRKAFSYAIDRAEIVEKVIPSGQTPAATFLPPSLSNRTFAMSNPSLACVHFRQALEELKIEPQELESLTLYYKASQVEKRLAQTLQRQWKETLGITIQLVQLDFKSHAQRLQNRDYQISLASWIAQFHDPISILERFKERRLLKNYPGWEDSEYIHWLDLALDSAERSTLFEKAIEILADKVPLTPIYHWNAPTLCSSRIQDVAATPCGGVLFERFSLAKKK